MINYTDHETHHKLKFCQRQLQYDFNTTSRDPNLTYKSFIGRVADYFSSSGLKERNWCPHTAAADPFLWPRGA